MLYLLDANVVIDANRDYYPITRVPEFWDWLSHHGSIDNVKIPKEIHEEFKESRDALGDWSRQPQFEKSLLLNEEAMPDLVSRIVSEGYAPDLTDEDIIKLGRDPFLLSYALEDLGQRTIVTTEVSSPKKQRANRKIPDVCSTFGIPCINTFEFVRALDFKTGWHC